MQDKGTFEFKRFFGDATNLVTAGAYADGYYFVARAANIQSSDGSKLTVPTDLLRYDVNNEEYEVWGDIINSAPIIYDMTYGYSTGTLYAISYDKSINSTQTQQASTNPSPTCRALPTTSSPLMASR